MQLPFVISLSNYLRRPLLWGYPTLFARLIKGFIFRKGQPRKRVLIILFLLNEKDARDTGEVAGSCLLRSKMKFRENRIQNERYDRGSRLFALAPTVTSILKS